MDQRKSDGFTNLLNEFKRVEANNFMHVKPALRKLTTGQPTKRTAHGHAVPENLDPRLDSEVEQNVRQLLELIPHIRPFAIAFKNVPEPMAAPIFDTVPFYLDLTAKSRDIHQGNTLLHSAMQKYMGRQSMDFLVPVYQLAYPEKFDPDTQVIWNLFLKAHIGYVPSLDVGPSELHRMITQRFDTWYQKCDRTPERALRKKFLGRLRTSNWLGDALHHWRKLDDLSPSTSRDRYSKEDVLTGIADMFHDCYFKPLGIKAPIRITLAATADEYAKTPACYDSKTGNIRLKVHKDTFGAPPSTRLFTFKNLRGSWNDNPAEIILMLLEELNHKFDHEVCKKYLAGGFPADSAWPAYARALLPQFPGTPGAQLYDRHTYYLFNPIEQNAESLMHDVFGVLEAKVAQAHMLAACSVPKKPVSENAGLTLQLPQSALL